MDQKKLVILVLVLIGVLALMALGAGTYVDIRDGDRKPDDYKPPSAMKAVGAVTSWMRTDFDLARLAGCGVAGSRFEFAGTCVATVAPGESRRPSGFTLGANHLVEACFAISRDKLQECISEGKDEPIREESDLTVARDSAFLFLRCNQPSGTCVVPVTTD